MSVDPKLVKLITEDASVLNRSDILEKYKKEGYSEDDILDSYDEVIEKSRDTAPAQTAEPRVSPKSRLATALLAFFLGTLGIHRFYLGKTGTAVFMLILGILGYATSVFMVGFVFVVAVAIWALVDFIIAIAGAMTDKEGRPVTKW